MFSPSARYLIASVMVGHDQKLLIWDRTNNGVREVALDSKKSVTQVGFDESERHIWLVLGRDPLYVFTGAEFALVDLLDGKVNSLTHFPNTVCDPTSCGFEGMTVSPTGNVIAYDTVTGEQQLREIASGHDSPLPEATRGGTAFTPRFSFDGKLLVYGNKAGGLNLYDVERRAKIWNRHVSELGGPSSEEVQDAAFSRINGVLLLAHNRFFRIPLDSATNMPAPAIEYKSAIGEIAAFSESPENHLLIAATSIGIDIFDESTGTLLATLITLNGGPWVVVSPTGQFDTEDPEAIDSLNWVMPDDPRRPLPIDIFMRDYFEPRLLPNTLARKTLKETSVASLNRVQPLVRIESVKWKDEPNGLAQVTVVVRGNTDKFPREGKTVNISTGVYDLRLFRDGQLVGWAPKTSVDWQLQPSPEDGLDLHHWREKNQIDLDADGSKHLNFVVQVARKKNLSQVMFTAYAFNEDRVKSATATAILKVDTPLKARTGNAYVISVGVNRTESSPAWDLQYAANDARQMSAVVGDKLEATKQFSQVVRIRLVSDQAGKEQPEEAAATKAHVEAVLDVLAGRRTVDEQLKNEIPGIDKVEKAQPEDLVLLAFSSHGYTDDRGVFHMVLADIGPKTPQNKITPELQRRSLSSNELSGWLREVDAGEMVMVVDSCHSAATVEAEGFKPGPMGSRGLGQLAYDKGMRILAASKSEQSAVEREGNKHGLLSYALIEEGLQQGLADFQPKDGKILMSEWLAYGEQEVPKLFTEGDAKGVIQRKGSPETEKDGYHGTKQTPLEYQQPVLFDFSKDPSDVALVTR